MKRILLASLTLLLAMSLHAEMLIGVRLFDMYGTEEVSVMTKSEYEALRADIKEESTIFKKALSIVKKDWEAQYKAAVKAGDKEFPKLPSKDFAEVRTLKTKNFTTKDAADKWLVKQKERVDEWMVAEAKRIKDMQKAAKGAMTSGDSSREAKKNRLRKEKKDLNVAVMEHLAETLELQMATMLKYNRPVPRIFIYDPIEGPGKNDKKLIEKQEKAIADYEARKAAAESGLAPADGTAPATPAGAAAPAAAPAATAQPPATK